MENNIKNVLVTGSEGVIGKILLDKLKCKYNFIIIKVDLSNFELLNNKFQSLEPIDCLIHLAADSSVSASWESVLKNNIIATRNIYESARKYKIKKVIFASSNHVTGLYEGVPPSLHLKADFEELIRVDMPVRPDSYYAISKVFGETFGKYISEICDMSVICLRIGTVLIDNNPTKNLRCRSTWLSHDDLTQLIYLSIESNIKFGIYYGVSNNSRRFWDMSNVEKELKYKPKDNAEKYFI